MNNSFDVNVLVNGNRCKFYHYQGRTYIQANHGSEYELEIKNNTWSRVLCLSSVDGLNVLTGETAKEDDAGYVIPSYSPLRIKGFRYSNNEVASFKFTDKHNSYAQSQGGNEAAQNCGVIGFKLYNEIVRTPIKVDIRWNPDYMLPQNINSCFVTSSWSSKSNQQPYCGGNTTSNTIHTSCCNNNEYKFGELKGTYASTEGTYNAAADSALRFFDMGSTWGKKVQSKVVETEFERGSLTFSLDIYYASRSSLQQMGIQLDNVTQINYPQSFLKKHATPPLNWRG